MGKVVCLGDALSVHCSEHGNRPAVITSILPDKISDLTDVNGKPVAYVGAKVQANCFDTGIISFAPGRGSFGTDNGEVIATTACGVGVGTPWDGNHGDRIDYLLAWNGTYNDVNIVE